MTPPADRMPERVEHGGVRHYHLDSECEPSVTAVLAMLPKGEPFERWLMRHGEDALRLRDEAGARGTAAHAAIEAWLRGLPMPPLAVDVAPLVLGAIEWIGRCGVRAVAIERPVFVPGVAGYGGTADLVFVAERPVLTIDPRVTLPAGVPIVGDWKTSTSVHDAHYAQLAAYADALGVEHAAVLLLDTYACIPHAVDLSRARRLWRAARELHALLGPAPCSSVAEAA
jgi:hypothetical protein